MAQQHMQAGPVRLLCPTIEVVLGQRSSHTLVDALESHPVAIKLSASLSHRMRLEARQYWDGKLHTN